MRLCFVKQTENTGSEKSLEPADADRQNSSGGSDSGNHYCCAFDACWAHMSSSELRILSQLPITGTETFLLIIGCSR